MNREDEMLEDAIREFVPMRMDDRLSRRLLMALDEASVSVTATDAIFESRLGVHRPAVMPDNFIERVEVATAPKVVAMATTGRVVSIRGYAAAAAVALFGAAAAFLAPISDERHVSAADSQSSGRQVPLSEVREFVPAGYARGLSEARDEGVVWKDNAPHRVLRIVYRDTITLRNEAGEVVEVEQPRVEYILVPKKID